MFRWVALAIGAAIGAGIWHLITIPLGAPTKKQTDTYDEQGPLRFRKFAGIAVGQ